MRGRLTCFLAGEPQPKAAENAHSSNPAGETVTGAKALKFKCRYIEAFNAMEAELLVRRDASPAVFDVRDPKVLAEVRRQLSAWSEGLDQEKAPSALPAH